METANTQKKYIIETIDVLPDDLIAELSNFISYLHYKSKKRLSSDSSSSAFLLSIAGLGISKENNVSQRDEEILANEVDTIGGWSLHLDKQE